MNYNSIYNNIITNRLNNPISGYIEKHHIIPKSLGGVNTSNNLVSLTAREHFLCHFLLTKIYKNESIEWYKMNKAFMMMKMTSLNQNRYFNSRLYESKRKNFSIVQSKCQTGKGNSQFGTIWIYHIVDGISIKILKDELNTYEALGWSKGRKNKQLNLEELKYRDNKKYLKELERIKIQEQKEYEKQLKITAKEEKIKQLNNYYQLYKQVGFEEFVKQTNYKFSKPNLVQNFKKYIPEFIPQNGKKR